MFLHTGIECDRRSIAAFWQITSENSGKSVTGRYTESCPSIVKGVISPDKHAVLEVESGINLSRSSVGTRKQSIIIIFVGRKRVVTEKESTILDIYVCTNVTLGCHDSIRI